MAAMTYYVAHAFMRSEEGGDIVACATRKRSAGQTKRSAWLPHWRGWRDIAEPSRSRGPATQPAP
jgi:hypothetical protein